MDTESQEASDGTTNLDAIIGSMPDLDAEAMEEIIDESRGRKAARRMAELEAENAELHKRLEEVKGLLSERAETKSAVLREECIESILRLIEEGGESDERKT